MTDISKRFGRVTVLRGVSFDILPGEVHILAGENGAGKSTLMKILGGVYSEYDGVLEVAGNVRRFDSPLAANAAGIAVIYQELSLIPAMTVTENIFIGRNLTLAGGFVRSRDQREAAKQLLGRLGLTIDVDRRVEQLPIAQQQLVEIAKALAQEARVIVMDEPTSSLSAPEVSKLFQLIDDLKKRGCGIIYISHKMEEIERIGDRITVLRDGQYVGTAPAADLPVAKLVNWMVGREMQEQFPRNAGHASDALPRLSIRNFTVRTRQRGEKPPVDNVNITVNRGEIVGIGGLQGSGASELMLGLFGAYGSHLVSGDVALDGKPFAIHSPASSIRAGIALLTNDRKATGLVLSLSILANATLAALGKVTPGGWRSTQREQELVEPLTRSFALKATSLHLEASALSGGNQQKVAIAKWLATGPTLFLCWMNQRAASTSARRRTSIG